MERMAKAIILSEAMAIRSSDGKESVEIPFMRNDYNIQISTKQPSFTQTSYEKNSPRIFPNSSTIYTSVNLIQKSLIKGISTLFFPKDRMPSGQKKSDSIAGRGIYTPKACQGSMTVEAAIVLPVFIFFFLNILWVIEIYRLHSTLLLSLREVGRELSVYAYAYDRLVQEEDDTGLEAFVENAAFSCLYVRGRVEEIAGREYLDSSPLAGGSSGISYLGSSIMQQNDILDLTASYAVLPFIKIAGFRPAAFISRYYGRAWTGYDVADKNDGKEQAIYVYVAENAKVYHLEEKCSHISLSIRESTQAEIERSRNDYGEKYTPCEACVTGGQNKAYITRTGNRYHQSLTCSSLKRTIIKMPLAEAEKHYGMCSRCGR